jgi:DNA-binding protein HU-beta
MNKAELIEALAEHYDGSKADATRALNAVVHTVSARTAAGERVAITGFGVFERVERPARTVRNPRTGEQLQAPATAVPRFRPGTELKAYVAGSRPVPELAVTPTPTRRTAAARVPQSEPEAPVGRVAEPAPAPQDAPEKKKKAEKDSASKKDSSSKKDKAPAKKKDSSAKKEDSSAGKGSDKKAKKAGSKKS